MGFVLSILYLVTHYLTPETVFGPLAAAHIELILAALILIVSLPRLTGSFILKTPQTLALIGLAIAVSCSVLVALRWAMGAVHGLMDFIPNAFAYFAVCLHCNSKKKLQVLVLMLLFVCLFVIAHGYIDLLHGVPESFTPQTGVSESADRTLWGLEHPYLLRMKNDVGEPLYRIKGLGEINDPNDFAQLLLCVIPLVFLFWQTNRLLQNAAFVILPVCILLFGVFLTHSRGALVALMAMAILAARRRIGTLPAVLLGGVLFFAAMALHFTGGRAISAESGSDRTSLWGEGLQILKAHPLFGVGYGNMAEYTDVHLTAHNSLVVCAVELGLFGLYFWSLFLLSTVRDALVIASPEKVNDIVPTIPDIRLYPQLAKKIETVDKAGVNRIGHLLILSLTGFLVAGLFLSRAYVMTLFLLGGIVEVTYEMAMRRGMIVPRLPLARALIYTFLLSIALITLMYIFLRTVNLLR